MGDIMIHVPQRIHIEYTLEYDNLTRHLLDILNTLILQRVPTRQADPGNELLGLFADQPDLLDHVTEQAMQARETDALRVHV
jgi:hypothetical protein